MKYNKLLRILFVFVVLMVCFNAVAAAEDMNIDAVGNSEESLQSNEPGSFKDLQDLINNNTGSTIELDRDYVYSGGSDKKYVTIDDSITINGNNHKINGNDQTWLLYLTYYAENVVLNNISFVHAKGQYYTLYIDGWKSTFANCTFENNDAPFGVYLTKNAEKISFSDSVFSNNTGDCPAMYIVGKDNVIEHTVFEDNQGFFTGGVYLYGSNNLIYDSVFRNNVAEYVGGALYCTGSNNTVNKSCN